VAQLLKLAKLPAFAGGGGRWVTEFEDRSSPRVANDELYFWRAADQATLGRRARAVYDNQGLLWLIASLVGIAALALGAIVYKRRRASRDRRLFG
jgi:hypothetical protein